MKLIKIVKQIGNSYGNIFSKEECKTMGIEIGDFIDLTDVHVIKKKDIENFIKTEKEIKENFIKTENVFEDLFKKEKEHKKFLKKELKSLREKIKGKK